MDTKKSPIIYSSFNMQSCIDYQKLIEVQSSKVNDQLSFKGYQKKKSIGGNYNGKRK